jgi:hypothetical protein
MEMKDYTGEVVTRREGTSSQKSPVSQKQSFSGLKQVAPDLVKKIKRFLPYHRDVGSNAEKNGDSILALREFLQRLDIALSIRKLSDVSEPFCKSWGIATKIDNERARRLVEEHKGDLRHKNTFLNKAIDYDAFIAWSKEVNSASFIVCGQKPLNQITRKMPAMLLQEVRLLNLPLESFVVEAEFSWIPKKFMFETEIGNLKELVFFVEGESTEKDSQGLPINPCLIVDAGCGKIEVKLFWDYLKKLPQIIDIIKPKYATLLMEKEDVEKWLAQSGYIKRSLIKLLIRGRIKNTEEGSIKLSVPFSWLEECGRIIGVNLLGGEKRNGTGIVSVESDCKKPADLFEGIKSMVSLAQEVMPCKEFKIFGKTGEMSAEKFYENGLPTRSEVTRFELTEVTGPDRGVVISQFLGLIPDGRYWDKMMFLFIVFPGGSILQEFQENILRRLGIAAPEDISENAPES